MSSNPNKGIYIGTMSGTSADGLDIVISDISSSEKISQLSSYFIEYPEEIASQIKELQLDSSITPSDLATNPSSKLSALDRELAHFFATHIELAIEKSSIQKKDIIAIGNHGQSILHQPNIENPFSLQICNAQTLSNLCGVPVIADFRSADIEKGGQGAPLIPAFHAHIFAPNTPCAIVNIGGIANTSILHENGVTLGFDNGPGNTLMNAWTKQHLHKNYDENGNWARSGKICEYLLDSLLADDYFLQPYPKSTGQDHFNIDWLKTHLHENLNPEDVQATLCELTAKSIINDIYSSNADDRNLLIKRIFVCGGGAQNSFLMERLKQHATTHNSLATIENTQTIGIDSDWMEALGFAWLAYCYCNNISSNLPSVTGAREKVVLGQKFNPIL